MSEPVELVNGVHVARASALVGLGRLADAVVPLQDFLASPTRGPDVETCRAQLAVALARLERWTEVEPVVAQLRESHTDEELYSSTIEYLAEAAYSKNQNDLAESLFQELANSDRSPRVSCTRPVGPGVAEVAAAGRCDSSRRPRSNNCCSGFPIVRSLPRRP